jgi:hypothetical protein
MVYSVRLKVPRLSPAPARARGVLAFALAGGAIAGFVAGPTLVDRAIYSFSSSLDARTRALDRLLDRGHVGALDYAIRFEEGSLHEHALARAPAFDVAGALADRLGRGPTLADLRAAAALGDERSLSVLADLLRTTERRPRAAAFTAFAAIVARRHVSAGTVPRFTWADARLLGELAAGLEEDSPAWRGDLLRALAGNLAPAPGELARMREEAAEDRALACFLWLRGDEVALARFPEEERALMGLLAPLEALGARVDAAFLDRVLALDQWGGAGDWRWLEAAPRDRLEWALALAPDRTRPAAVAAAFLVAGRFEPPPIDGIEDAPPPALALLGPRDVPALVRAAGRADGRLARVLEPGAGTMRERFLLDQALAAAARER